VLSDGIENLFRLHPSLVKIGDDVIHPLNLLDYLSFILLILVEINIPHDNSQGVSDLIVEDGKLGKVFLDLHKSCIFLLLKPDLIGDIPALGDGYNRLVPVLGIEGC